MYSLKMAQKQSREHLQQARSQEQEKRWIKRYNSDTKPRLLERYDFRINAFIRQVEEAPEDASKIDKHKSVDKYPAFQFKLTGNSKSRAKSDIKMAFEDEECSVSRSSAYVPLSQYQYRERQKQKEIAAKPTLKTLLYKKWQRQRQRQIKSSIKMKEQLTITNRNSYNETPRRVVDDNRSDVRSDIRSEIPSLGEDGQSLRLSANNFENLQREAREYEKNRLHVQKKTHFKRLANLEQLVKDAKAKRSLHSLLVKGGRTRPKLHEMGEDVEVDLLKVELERQQAYG